MIQLGIHTDNWRPLSLSFEGACDKIGFSQQIDMAVENEEPQTDDTDEVSALEQELRELLREQSGEAASGTESCLIGWWEATCEDKRAFLPVFDDVSPAVSAFVNAMPEPVDARKTSEELHLPEAVLSRFVALARRPEARTEYFGLDEITPDQLRAVLDDVALGGFETAEVEDLGWLEQGQGGDAGELLAIEVDGHLVRVDASVIAELRKEWERYEEEFGICEQPALARALAPLLLSKCVKEGIARDEATIILDAAAELGSFPSTRRIVTRASMPGFLKALRIKPTEAWSEVVNRAWNSGLSESFPNKSRLLIAAIAETVGAS